VDHCIHSPFEKRLVERKIDASKIKPKKEINNDYFPYVTKNCELKYAENRLQLFVDYHNKEIKLVK
jgi:hypothetical protein